MIIDGFLLGIGAILAPVALFFIVCAILTIANLLP